MYKNQLQELAQRSCFNLPSYTCIREGPDHAPRFKATVNFNGEIFESPHYCSTLRQAEHSAAEVALNYLSNRGPSHSLAARILVSSLSLSPSPVAVRATLGFCARGSQSPLGGFWLFARFLTDHLVSELAIENNTSRNLNLNFVF